MHELAKVACREHVSLSGCKTRTSTFWASEYCWGSPSVPKLLDVSRRGGWRARRGRSWAIVKLLAPPFDVTSGCGEETPLARDSGDGLGFTSSAKGRTVVSRAPPVAVPPPALIPDAGSGIVGWPRPRNGLPPPALIADAGSGIVGWPRPRESVALRGRSTCGAT